VLKARWRRRRGGRRAVAQVIGVILLVAITVVTMTVIYMIRYPLPSAPPTIGYAAVNNVKFPVWGDPTDCYPRLPYDWEYYLGNGTGNQTDQNRYNTYMDAWDTQCENDNDGQYNLMNATQIFITSVSQPILLSAIQFRFVCQNETPTPKTTVLVQGMLDKMEWVPGSNVTLPSSAPELGTCGTYDPRGSGANSVYYNRLGFFDPLDTKTPELTAGMSIILYVHTADSVLEAPSPIEPSSSWGQPDADDYHGAPVWCFTDPGSCTLQLVDTSWTTSVVVLSVPLFML
jgi:hypothetical protein